MTPDGYQPQQQGPYGPPRQNPYPPQGQYPQQPAPQQYGPPPGQYPPPGGQFPYGQPPQPPRSKAPWLWSGLAVIVVAAVAVTLVLTLGGGKKHHNDNAKTGNSGGNSKTSSPRNAVNAWLDADKTHNVNEAKSVVCPAKRSQVTDPNADIGLDDNIGSFTSTINKVQTSGSSATVDVTVTAPQGSQQGTFQLVRQSPDWFVCGLTKQQPVGPNGNSPSGNPPSQNAPAGQGGAATPDQVVNDWMAAIRAENPQAALNFVCPAKRAEAANDPNSELYVSADANTSSLQWSVLSVTTSGPQAIVKTQVTLNGNQKTLTITTEQISNAFYVCDLQE